MRRASNLSVLLTLVILAGCGGTAETTTQPTATPSTSAAPSSAPSGSPAAAPSGGGLKIGFQAISMSDINAASMIRELQPLAAARGWSFDVIDAEGDVDKANSAIQNLVQRGDDAIIVSIFTTDSLQAGIQAAVGKGIPVVSHGGNPGPGVQAVFNGNGGDVVARRIVQDMGGTKGEVLAFTYSPGYPCLIREQAFDSIMISYPDVKVTKQQVVLPGFADAAAATTTAWLQTHPVGGGPYAVWGCWDGPGLGAISALKQAGRTDVKVYGFNGDADALVAMKQGQMTYTLWWDNKAEAEATLDTIGLIKAAGDAWQPGVFETPYVALDSSNIDKFLSDHPEIDLK